MSDAKTPSERDEQRRRDDSFLAEASRLLASSLDYETTLSTVAGLALPHLGSWCIVDIVEESGDVRRLAIVHPDEEKQALARELREGWPPSRTDPLGVPAVAHTLRSEVIPAVDTGFLDRVARSERNREILERLGIGSLLSVPLVARGDVLGAMTFVGGPDGRQVADRDLELAEDLAHRAAIAIDNARLYTAARRAREAAEMASRAKSQFLGVMSHELRTPINAILGYAQLLDMGVKGQLSEEQRTLLNRIEGSGRHLLELVTRVLDVSKAEAGELAVSNEVTLVHDVMASLERILAQKTPDGVSVEIDCSAGDDRFFGDGIRVRQILIQLITNAFRFTGEGGHVRVGCQRIDGPAPTEVLRGAGGPWVRIDIEDDGIGIPDAKLEAIFEPFVQADSAEFTRSTDGSGLGLAVSRNLARLMGGDITVTSEPGRGSRFSLWLPAPAQDVAEDEERRLFDREDNELPLLGEHLLRRLKPILDAYVERLRHDSTVPARGALHVELQDHVAHFIAGLANLLTHTGSGKNISAVLRGDSAIQRMTLELHGAQRHQLGWTAEALARDLDILRHTIRHDVRSTGTPALRHEHPLEVLDRLFEQAQHISLQGWKHARDSAPDTTGAGLASDPWPALHT